MGVDLTLLIDKHYEMGERKLLAYDRIAMDRGVWWLFGGMGKPIPKGFVVQWYGDKGIEETDKDSMGSRLTFTHAGEIQEVLNDSDYAEQIELATRWNHAVYALLRDLPFDMAVIMWRH